MAEISIVITDVKLTPNPCKTGERIILSVGIADRIFGILTSTNKLALTGVGKAIEYNN